MFQSFSMYSDLQFGWSMWILFKKKASLGTFLSDSVLPRLIWNFGNEFLRILEFVIGLHKFSSILEIFNAYLKFSLHFRNSQGTSWIFSPFFKLLIYLHIFQKLLVYFENSRCTSEILGAFINSRRISWILGKFYKFSLHFINLGPTWLVMTCHLKLRHFAFYVFFFSNFKYQWNNSLFWHRSCKGNFILGLILASQFFFLVILYFWSPLISGYVRAKGNLWVSEIPSNRQIIQHFQKAYWWLDGL